MPLPLNDENLSYHIQNRDGDILVRSHKSPLDKLKKIPLGFSNQAGMRVFGSSTEDGNLQIYVFEPIKHRNEILQDLLIYLAIPFLLIIPLTYLSIKNVSNNISRDIQIYTRELLILDDANPRSINIDSLPIELKEIGDSTNKLLNKIAKSFQDEKNFSESISHELKTPIAICLANLDVLRNKSNDTNLDSYFLKVRESLIHLEKIIKRLLQISRSNVSFERSETATDIRQILDFVLDQLKSKSNREYQVITHLYDHFSTHVDPDAVGIMLMNLLENADQYAINHSPINIVIGPDQTIKIQNECLLIPEDQINLILKKYKRNQSYNFNHNNSGIGLTIVKMIAEKVGVTFSIESPIPGCTNGFQATLNF